jgi:S-adenosylmethionine synthetase
MDAIGGMASAHVGDGHPMVMFGFAVTEHRLKKGLVMPAPFSIARALLCVQDALP